AAMVTAEGIPEAGIDSDSRMALYGVGLLPVLRVTLSDPAKLDATFAKFEARAGKEMSVGTLDGHSYRYAGNDDARAIFAVLGDQFVVTVVPATLGEDLLKGVLGLTPPARSIADSGELQALAEKYGYTAYGLGLVDVERVASTFLDEQSGVNSALLAMMGHDSGSLSDVCREEIRAVAGVAPRVVTGYTEMTRERFRSNTVFELRSDLALGLQGITSPVPGLGQQHGGLLSFGMSFDLPAFREFYGARLDALEADPFECELFADLQSGVATARAALNQPLPPMASDFRGFLAVIEDIKGMDFATKQPPTEIDMRFLVATGNAQGLVAMGAMFSPEIAALELKPDATPVQLPLPAGAAPIDTAWVAMSEEALALSVGNGGETGLAEMLKAGFEEPPPFMSMDVDAGRYYGFLGDVMTSTDMSDSGEEVSAEVAQATGDLMRSFESMFERVSFDVQFTERGIEMPSTMVLAD
ncbi:MAG: hypothetical protein JXB36_17415, partial [Gammaproteobacteria bacterium]|nr:hypothetical protein [Gammaproteobacteria bacterium]